MGSPNNVSLPNIVVEVCLFSSVYSPCFTDRSILCSPRTCFSLLCRFHILPLPLLLPLYYPSALFLCIVLFPRLLFLSRYMGRVDGSDYAGGMPARISSARGRWHPLYSRCSWSISPEDRSRGSTRVSRSLNISNEYKSTKVSVDKQRDVVREHGPGHRRALRMKLCRQLPRGTYRVVRRSCDLPVSVVHLPTIVLHSVCYVSVWEARCRHNVCSCVLLLLPC